MFSYHLTTTIAIKVKICIANETDIWIQGYSEQNAISHASTNRLPKNNMFTVITDFRLGFSPTENSSILFDQVSCSLCFQK
jgi:hypothetical protein